MKSNQHLRILQRLTCSLIPAFALTLTFAGLSFVAPQQVSAQAQVVQLPTFRNFVYRGAVKVPDGGSTLLGGTSRSASGAYGSGVPILGGIPGVGRGFRNRGIGSENNSAKASVTAKILILEELEAQMLAEAKANGTIRNVDQFNELVRQKAAFLTKHVGRRSETLGSYSENRR